MTTFEVFFDGECPLCKREVDFVRRLDRKGQLQFTDIAAKDFDPSSIGRTYDDLMAKIHGRDADGELVTGVEVFRRMYAAIGLGPLVALSRIGPFATLAEAGYTWFAKNRLALTGRCDTGTCAVPQASSDPKSSLA